ncbi:hypothetical protein [Saccharopolyspora sp. CA-218241]
MLNRGEFALRPGAEPVGGDPAAALPGTAVHLAGGERCTVPEDFSPSP